MKGRILYAAYGTSINRTQMLRKCPEAIEAGTATLKNYRLLFKGTHETAYATVERAMRRTVPVLAWWLTNDDVLRLDRYEGYPTIRRKNEVRIKLGHRCRWAMIHVLQYESFLGYPHKPGKPSDGYLAIIQEGYNQCGFDLATLHRAVEESVPS